jgi:hypothetical protein
MSVVPCPDCVSDGVDCPLMIDGECLHSTGHAASVADRSSTDRPSAAIRWWVDTGPLDPLASVFVPGRRL